ncbi:hypothetical protein [Aquilutibacter rugosus]|uniref:hypothetical protein n=1 Tax=Aquilutibacter rugosus TaxID=3115820 RepID=UPI002F3F87D1
MSGPSIFDIGFVLNAINGQKRYLFTPAFTDWLIENWHVWQAFKRQADRVWNAGRRHYSARTIIEVMRHESLIADSDAEFKINNKAAPDMARLYMVIYPDRHGFFEVRTQDSSERAKAA